MNQQLLTSFDFHSWQRIAFIATGAGVLLSGIGLFVDYSQFTVAYLFGYIYWLNITLGFLGIIMLHHMVSGRWGFVIQRIGEAGMQTLLLMVLLFIPILFMMGTLFPWTHHATPEAQVVLHHKGEYLNVPFFIVRAVIYFAAWGGLAFLLSRWSERQDATGDTRLTRSLQRLSAPGIIVYVVTMTFASIDWIMSMEPEWFSSIFGMLIVVSQVLGAFALATVVLWRLSLVKPVADIVSPGHFHDLGNLLLTFVVLWAYMSFSQLLIIWEGNLPEEIPWYLKRLGEGWWSLALVLVVLHFFVPFFILLMRGAKRSAPRLATIAAFLLVMRALETYWVIVPGPGEEAHHVPWMGLGTLLGIGGLWALLFIRRLRRHSLIPAHDPRFAVLTEPVQG